MSVSSPRSPPRVFNRSLGTRSSFTDALGTRHDMVEGRLAWANFSFLPRLLQPELAARLLSHAESLDLDVRPDSVDGLPAYELYVMRDAEVVQPELHRMMRESLARLTDWANAKSPICRAPRRCTPCTSLLRRYSPEDRDSHPEHVDGHAAVTAVTALSEEEACALPRHSRPSTAVTAGR